MKTSVKVLIVILLILDIAMAAIVFGLPELDRKEVTLREPETAATEAPTLPPETTAAPTLPPETTVPETTVPETTVPETTQPEKNTFLLTFAGDCTLGTSPGTWNAGPGFIKTIGSNLTYPFKSVATYFQEDDFSLVNLEGPLTEGGSATNGKTSYRGPVSYVEILTGAGIEGVTLANDHIMDYGEEGYTSTLNTLTTAGVAYAERDKATVVQTDSGLSIGLYAFNAVNAKGVDVTDAIASLKEQGAELIIAAPHWGVPGYFDEVESQRELGRAAIDAGAHIVVGTHPHVLQPIEEYGGGIIYYSLGRFVFGGASISQDWDTAIVQQEVLRQEDGTISLGELKVIPASIGNKPGVNNYQPTPYPKEKEGYGRVLHKLGLD